MTNNNFYVNEMWTTGRVEKYINTLVNLRNEARVIGDFGEWCYLEEQIENFVKTLRQLATNARDAYDFNAWCACEEQIDLCKRVISR